MNFSAHRIYDDFRKMYKFLAEQRTNLLLNRIVQTVEDIGVHNLEE